MSGLTLMEQINQMALDADKAKKDATESGAALKKRSDKARRKSRDLEQDFFGNFLEETKEIDAAFEKFDTDKSGGISKDELTEAIKAIKSATPPPDAVFAKMITECADRRNGVPDTQPCNEISLENFRKMVNKIKNKEFDDYAADAVDENLRGMFDAADVDKSNSISKDELKVAVKSIGESCFEMSDEQWGKVMSYAHEKKDDEGKGTEFSFDDFCKLVEAIRAGKVV